MKPTSFLVWTLGVWFVALPTFAQEFRAFSDSEAAEHSEQDDRERAFRLHNSWLGSVGGVHVLDARSGPKGSFRVQLGGDFFFTNNFLLSGDQHDYVGGVLSFSWTPLSFLELFGAVLGYSNSNPLEDPSLFQVVGDTHLGVKAFYHLNPWLSVGGDARAILLNSVGDVGLSLESTSMQLGANLSADFRGLRTPIPLISRLNLRYFWDNSSELISDVERARYNALPDPAASPTNEYRHLISRVERFALNINRVDRLDISLGAEAPLKIAEDFYINPIAEWQLGIPINRQNYNCLFVARTADSNEPIGEEDGCLQKSGFKAFPMVLTLGMRLLPPVRGLAAMAAVDIGLQGASEFVRELVPVAPYKVLLSLSYAYDTVQPASKAVEQQAEVIKRPMPTGNIHGQVLEAGTGRAIANATIRFLDKGLNPLLSEADGTFLSYDFDGGEQISIQVGAEGYSNGTCATTIPVQGGMSDLLCELVAEQIKPELSGQIKDEKQVPISRAKIDLTGPVTQSAQSTDSGAFSFADLEPGEYLLRVEAPGYLIKQERITVKAEEMPSIELVLVAEPKRSLVQMTGKQLKLLRQVHFDSGSTNIALDSTALMEQLADMLLRHPEIKRVEIQGHTDNVGGAELNKRLSQERADAVRQWLIAEGGIDPSRLEAKGYGMERPLLPNITRQNRARNRRVQFNILERE
ncbi:MAG: DUF2012 domain-containing protein [Myxococcales bacterium]|nr:MAG: DUF2012 domain-containing protein [Myxococcales bacterium]